MRVRHERPMSDLSFKVRAPLKLTLENGKFVTLENWSLSGAIYPEDTDILPKAGVLAIPFQGVEVQFNVKFDDGREKNEILFKDLSGRQRETLAIFYRSLLSGKMASSQEVITSLDTPVDLVPMGETKEEETAGKSQSSNRFLRVLWNVFFYLLFAVVVFGMLGSQMLNRLSVVSLQHARIVAPLVTLHAPEGAFVDEILVDQGSQVLRGETLVRLNNPNRAADLEDVREDIALYERRVQEVEERVLAHRALRTRERERLFRNYVEAVTFRQTLDFFAGRNLERVQITWHALKAFDQATDSKIGPHFDFERQLERDLEDHKNRLSRLKRDLGNIKDGIAAADIVAPADGVVVLVDVFEDQFIARGTIAVTLEENKPRMVQAWLNEERSGAIHVGMPTRIRFNDGLQSRSVDGTITDITAQVDQTISDEFGLVVSVSFVDMDLSQIRSSFRNDAPVQLDALKDWAFSPPWKQDL